MQRAAWIVALCGAIGYAGTASPAAASRDDAKPSKRSAKSSTSAHAKVQAAMGPLAWGMRARDVMALWQKRIEKRYQKRFSALKDVTREDALRAARARELKRLRDGYTRFTGRGNRWDGTFLQPEYTHHNGEAVLVVHTPKAENYYFFIQDRLWKWYRVLSDAHSAKTPEQLVAQLEGRYGPAKADKGQLHRGAAPSRWSAWNTGSTRVRLMDERRFYGFYGLVYEDRKTLARLPQLRQTEPKAWRKSSHSLVDMVTQSNATSDDNADVIDRITGQKRSIAKP
ncbi:MAG: hypothetical protein ACPGUV_07835 [Polyangiales bacterium]